MTYRGNFSKHPVALETGSPAYTRTCLAQSSDLELKPTQATLLVCLSWDALCVPQAVGSKRGHPSTSYIWSFSLTVSPVTNFPHGKNKKKIKISKQKNIYIFLYIYSNIANQSNFRKCYVDLIHISNLKPLKPSSSFF